MISVANKNDVAGLVDLVNTAYRGDSSKKGWTTEADLLGGQRTDPEIMLASINQANTTILKYEDPQQQLIACVSLEQKSDKMYLGMLTVSPELQAAGLGKKLVEASEKYALEQGCKAVFMSVISARTELIAWYERRGYCITGEKKPFPMNDPNFGLPNQFLEFIVMEKSIK